MRASMLESMVGAPANDDERMEHRFGRRYHCGSPVRLSAGDGLDADARLSNVSLSGACIQTTLELPPFCLVSLTKTVDDGSTVELLASVVRSDARGVGVEWSETPVRSICQLLGCPRPCHA
jgi:hypothetical protein